MLAIERRNRILAKLKAEKHVVVSELAKLFSVSEETIRRDLDRMEKDGLVVKSYGGAVLSERGTAELQFIVRKRSNVEEKLIIAEIAASLVNDGDAIILDASSTAVFIAQKLKSKKKYYPHHQFGGGSDGTLRRNGLAHPFHRRNAQRGIVRAGRSACRVHACRLSCR